MCCIDFLNWLLKEKHLSQRAAKDVISRCKRICNILKTKNIDVATINELNKNSEFENKSIFIKSQLRRAVNLWVEFEGENVKETVLNGEKSNA